MNNAEYEMLFEELNEILGREPTIEEIQNYIEELESRYIDNLESHLEDIESGHYNTD